VFTDAGNPTVFNQTCTGVCYTDYVLNSSSYATAYFEIQSVRVYGDASKAAVNTTASSTKGNTSGAVRLDFFASQRWIGIVPLVAAAVALVWA
jgi:hypothetical protein